MKYPTPRRRAFLGSIATGSDLAGSRRRRRTLLGLESLENRELLATFTWTGGGDGVNWLDAYNWTEQAIPGAGDDVIVSATPEPPVSRIPTISRFAALPFSLAASS